MSTIIQQGLAFIRYSADGSSSNFPIPFSYLKKEYIQVTVNGEPAAFTWLNDSEIHITDLPSVNDIVFINRQTHENARLVNFQDGGTLREKILDLDSDQIFDLVQESLDWRNLTATYNPSVGGIDAMGNKILNLGNGTNPTDAVNVQQLQAERPAIQQAATQALTDIADATAGALDLIEDEVVKATDEADRSFDEAERAKDEADRASSEADEARDWAIKTDGPVDVVDEEYSSKFHALRAKNSENEARYYAEQASMYMPVPVGTTLQIMDDVAPDGFLAMSGQAVTSAYPYLRAKMLKFFFAEDIEQQRSILASAPGSGKNYINSDPLYYSGIMDRVLLISADTYLNTTLVGPDFFFARRGSVEGVIELSKDVDFVSGVGLASINNMKNIRLCHYKLNSNNDPMLPDMNGTKSFARGNDGKRPFGGIQADAFKEHTHKVANTIQADAGGWTTDSFNSTNNRYLNFYSYRSGFDTSYAFKGSSNVPTVGEVGPTGISETRPVNHAFLWIIKY